MSKLRRNDLKDLIHKTGHSLKSFCEKYALSLGSVKAWNTLIRNPGYGSAVKISTALKAEGIDCPPETLMGRPVYILRELESSSTPPADAELGAINDASSFKKNNANAALLMVWDDKMAPLFEEGDYVGGTILEQKELPQAHGKICILKEKNKEKVLRNIVFKEGSFFSYYKKRPSHMKLNEIEFLAPVVFVRKKAPFSNK